MITGTRAVGLYVPDQLRELATDFRVIEKARTVRLKSQILPFKKTNWPMPLMAHRRT